MSLCCSVTPGVDPPVLASKKWGVVIGSYGVIIPNRCPCAGGQRPDGTECKVEFRAKPNWMGWDGQLDAKTTWNSPPSNVTFSFDVTCRNQFGVGVYMLSVISGQGCGSSADMPLNGRCNELSGEGMWAPAGACECCNCLPGEAPYLQIVISDSDPTAPPFVLPEEECICNGGTRQNPDVPESGSSGSIPSPSSSFPIRYATGELMYSATDFTASGFGLPWGQTRRFSNRLTVSRDPGNGYNWFIDQWQYLERVPVSGQSYVVVMGGAGKPIWFRELSDDVYQATFGDKRTLTLDRSAGCFALASRDGAITEFDIVTGLLTRHTSPGGQVIEVTALTDSQTKIASLEQTVTVDGVATTDRYQYGYTQPYDQRLADITLSRRVDAGSWQNVQRAVYTYYGADENYGDAGDLKTVVNQMWGGSDWNTTGTSYYRYWKDGTGSSSSSSSGLPPVYEPLHLLKLVVEPAAFARLVADGYDPLLDSDAILALYADYYYEFDDERRVTKELVQGGSRTFLFAYEESDFTDGYNSWKTKTTETLPDGNRNIVYCNFAGQPMLKVFQSDDEEWLNFYRYDDSAHLILQAEPSAVTGYDESYADLLHYDVMSGTYEFLKDNEGLIHSSTYHAPSGYLESESLQQGQLGDSILLREYEYCCCGADCGCGSSSSSSSGTGCESGVWLLKKGTVYPSDTDPTKKLITSHCYTFYPDTCAVKEHVITLPVVGTDQNGSGMAATRREYFDIYGNLTWTMDERGFITRMVYDIPTGAVIQQVADVDTSEYDDVPDGWSTPLGGGLNVVTDFEHDDQGRTTQTLGPSHSIDLDGSETTIRTASWTVYDEVNHVTYSGQGYATGTAPAYEYTLIDPVSITKMDAGGRVNEQIQATAPSTSGTLAEIIEDAGGGEDAFPQSSYTSWTTTQYTDCCLAASQRVYHTIPASGEGSSGTNYDETDFGYDVMKRRNRTVTPGGTITDLVYEPRGMVVGTYVGTNDDGATEDDPTGGGVDPDNNMVLDTENEYDDDTDGGDGNLTEMTQHVDGTTFRVTAMTYDFRDRRVTTDGEVDYFEKSYYDNLDRVVMSERYDTSEEGNLIARSETLFDDRGRVYQSVRYAVDPDTGDVGNSLTDNTWFDDAGNVIKSLPSGSSLFTKTKYDSLNRPQTRYTGYDLDETGYPG